MSTKVRWHHLFPQSWEFVPAKWLFPESKARAGLDDEQLTASQEWGVIPQKEFIRRAGRRVVELNDHLDRRKRVERDDFVISMRSFQGGLERAWAEGGIRSSYVVLKPRPEANVGYFARLFKCEQYIRALQATALFIRDGQDLSYQNFTLVDLPLPPKREQTQIARFLDYETARIDALIEKQQQLIALLKEKRQAVISHAVTKGLNPNAPLRSSGIEWLGTVPAHWDVVPFRHTFDIANGQADPRREPFASMPLIAPNHIESGTGRLSAVDSAREQDAISGKYAVHRGEIVYSKIRPALRKATLAPFDCLCSADMYALRPRNAYSAQFLLSVLLSEYFSDTVVLESLRVAMPKVNRETLAPIFLALPPPSEQLEIAEYIASTTAKLDRLVEQANALMDLLQERRTALISAAVTGKIDVRNWTPPESKSERDVA